MDPERITRGVISLTTGDSRRGSLGSIFRFLGLCVCLGVQRGLSRVLIKYSGNVRLQIRIISKRRMRKCERKITRPLANEFRMRQWVGDSRTIALVAKPTSRIPFVTSEWREHFKMLGCTRGESPCRDSCFVNKQVSSYS